MRMRLIAGTQRRAMVALGSEVGSTWRISGCASAPTFVVAGAIDIPQALFEAVLVY